MSTNLWFSLNAIMEQNATKWRNGKNGNDGSFTFSLSLNHQELGATIVIMIPLDNSFGETV